MGSQPLEMKALDKEVGSEERCTMSREACPSEVSQQLRIGILFPYVTQECQDIETELLHESSGGRDPKKNIHHLWTAYFGMIKLNK